MHVDSAHPRLWLTEKAVARMGPCLQHAGPAQALLEELKHRAEGFRSLPPVAFVKKGRRLLEATRQSQERIVLGSWLLRMEHDPELLARVKEEMLHAAAEESWNPDHFLDVGEMAFGLAVGYDSLYAELSEEDRTLIENAILDKALRCSVEAEHKGAWWIEGRNNWNQVCHGGLVVAALAVWERDPQLCEFIVRRALENLHHAAAAYAPDGAYPEGPMYWCYGTTFHVLMIDALRSVFGTDFGMSDFEGFLESSDYLRQTRGPTGLIFNYADARELWGASAATGLFGRRLNGKKNGFNTTLYWFARERGCREVVELEEEVLETRPAEVLSLADRFLPFVAGWRDFSVEEPPPEDSILPCYVYYRGKTPIALHRTRWGDPGALFVGLKGGSPGHHHGHMDAGSFVVDAGGVRWAVDPGMQEYEDIEATGLNLWDFGPDGDRWKIFRLGPEGHNILRFNRGRQWPQATTTLLEFCDTGLFPHTTLDLTALYPTSVEACRRTVGIFEEREIRIRDEWTSTDRDQEVSWQWLTRAEAKVTAEGFLLEQEGRCLRLRVKAFFPWTGVVEDMEEPPGAWGARNPDLKRLTLRLGPAASTTSDGWIDVNAQLVALRPRPH
ncbi:MAG: heparinase II/III family protein [Opitutales bacterium]